MNHHEDNTPPTPASLVDSAVETTMRLDRKVRRLNQELTSVHETSRLLTGPMDLQQVLEIVLRTTVQALHLDAGGVRLLDENTGVLTLKATYGLSEAYRNKGPVTAGESTLNTRALAGETVVVDDMRTDPRFQKYRDEIDREGLVCNLTLGLMYRDKGIGMMRLYSKTPRRFTAEDVSLAQTIAAQSAAAIVNARLYQEALQADRLSRQLKLAGDVQRHLIPSTPPDLPGYDLAGQYVPCYDIGGDFYDFIVRDEQHVILTIGDVMGKGVPSSLTMASLRSSMRAYSDDVDSISALVSRVNRLFCHDIAHGVFATLFCAELDIKNHTLTYCNAGHNPPIHFQQNAVHSLSEGGMVVGIDPDSCYSEQTLTFQPGDLLLMFTDGLIEAVNFEREQFGLPRLIQAVDAFRPLSAAQAAKSILWTMRKFTGLTQRFDDTALVVLKKLEASHD